MTQETQGLTRRGLVVGAGAAALAPGAVLAQSDGVAAAEQALGAAERSGDPTAIVKARLTLAIELKGPYFGQTDADLSRARQLFESLGAPALRRAAPNGFAMARLFAGEMLIEQRRRPREAALGEIRSAARDAAAAALPALALRTANLGLAGALLANDLADAVRWEGAGAQAAGSARSSIRGEEGAALVDADAVRFHALAARLAARKGNAEAAWAALEASKSRSPDAARLVRQRAGADIARAGANASRGLAAFDAVVGVIVSAAGGTLLVTKKTPRGAATTIVDLRTYENLPFDDEELEMLLWGSRWAETFRRGALGGFMGAYAADDGPAGTSTGAVFRRELEPLARSFWAYYAGPIVRALSDAGVPSGGAVALILPSELAGLPFRMASDPKTGRAVIDHYATAEFPDAATLAARTAAAPPAARRMTGLFNPTGDLEGAEAERALVGAALGGDIAPIAAGLSGRAFLAAMKSSGAPYLYLASHGAFGVVANDRAGLALGKGQSLTIEDVHALAGGLPARLFILSACETGKASMLLQREPSHLPNALLGRGVAGVVAALWKVPDTPTTLLMHKMMRGHFSEGLAPADALRRAQIFLRDGTMNAFLEELVGAMEEDPARDWSAVEALAARLSEEDGAARPYAHPYHWAGFAYYGA